MVSRLAAEDGLTIRQITNSKIIRQLFIDSNQYKIPKCETDTMDLIKSFYDAKKNEVEMKLHKLKKNGCKFSLTLDEWTSLRNSWIM